MDVRVGPLRRLRTEELMLLNFAVGEDSWESSVMSDSVRPYGLYSPPGSSVHGVHQARVLEWIAMPFSRDNGILLSHKNEQNFAICSNMDELRKNYSK